MFRKIFSYISEKLGIKYLSNHFMRYVLMHGLFSVGFSLSTVFVGTFLFKIDASFSFVARYYLILHSFELVGSILSLKLLRVLKPTNVSRIGLMLYTASYLLIVALRENAGSYIVLIAACAGFGSSTYYMPYHNYTIDYTTVENRQYGISLHGMIGQAVGLVMPALAGIIISSMAGDDGYFLVFTITAIAMFISMLVAGKLPSTPVGGEKKIVTNYIKTVVKKYKFVRLFWLASMFVGLSTGVFSYYLNVAVFSISGSEAVAGYITSVKAIACILVYYVIRTSLSRRSKMLQMTVAAAAIVLWTASLFLWYSLASILIFSVAYAAIFNLIENGSRFVMFDVTARLKEEGVDNNYALISLRENGLNLGRCLSLVVALLMPPEAGNAVWMLLLLASFTVPAAWTLFTVDKMVVNEKITLFSRKRLKK